MVGGIIICEAYRFDSIFVISDVVGFRRNSTFKFFKSMCEIRNN